MEVNYTEDHLGNEGKVGPKPPKLEFSVLQNTINLEEVLSSDAGKRPSALQFRMPGEEFVNQNPGDLAASYLLDKLHRSHVTIEEYKETMPNLLKMAEKPGGGFDKDFISVTVRQFDRIWARMTDGRSLVRFGSPDFDKHIPNRREYFARAYGRVEAIKDYIWDNPGTAGKKAELIETANLGMQTARPEYHRQFAAKITPK